MGYFRPKLDRGRCGTHKRRFAQRATGGNPAVWQAMELRPPRPAKHQFIRLAAGPKHARSRQQLGVFRVLDYLEENDCLTPAESRRLDAAVRWFNDHLHAPHLGKPRAVFWFKSDARQYISRLWQIVSVLQRAGVTVYAIQTRDPGRIVYEDDCQVAAIPRGDWLQVASRELSEHTPEDLLSVLTPATRS